MLKFKPPMLPTSLTLGSEDATEKASLKNFLKSQQGALALRNSGQALASSLHTTIAELGGSVSLFGNKETEENFSQGVKNIVQSSGFTDELSDAIGIPLPDETEDEFVARAKAKMTDLLKKKLSK